MSDPLVTRYDVTFRASEEVDGRLLISLVLSQGGVAVSDGTPTFFLEPNDEVSPEETVLMARCGFRDSDRGKLPLAEAGRCDLLRPRLCRSGPAR